MINRMDFLSFFFFIDLVGRVGFDIGRKTEYFLFENLLPREPQRKRNVWWLAKNQIAFEMKYSDNYNMNIDDQFLR